MIQRIQSIYLLLAACALAATFLFPLATASGDTAALSAMTNNYFSDSKYEARELTGLPFELAIAFLVVVSIFRYKDRRRQMFSVGMAALLCGVFLIMYASLGFYYAQRLPDGSAAHLALGSAGIPAAVVLLVLAYYAIRRDENLVRSSDRLR